MSDFDADWPAAGSPGPRIGAAAELLQITRKAIRVDHEHVLVPEPDRDASGYRRYDAKTLVVLARITRLRAAGLSLRAIRPLLAADDRGARLRAALQDLDESLCDQIERLERPGPARGHRTGSLRRRPRRRRCHPRSVAFGSLS